MNYIKQLKLDKEAAELTNYRYKLGLQDIAGYLVSDKFDDDTTVQVKDILLRLAEVNSHANSVQYSDLLPEVK